MIASIPRLGFVAFLLFPLLARADVEFEHKKQPCSADYREFCHTEKPKTKGFVECMGRHMGELRPECQAQIKTLREELGKVADAARKAREACSDDFFKHCQGVPLGDESLRRSCLIRHKRELSEACLATLKK